jgi:DNA-binding NarL/FixJ family response regulator
VTPPVAGAATTRSRRVLVVDDHRVFAEVLADHLRRTPDVTAVSVAFTVEEARQRAERQHPDLVLLDPHLDGESGLDLLHHLDLLPSRPRVLVVADLSDPSAVAQGLVLGVRGWVSKESAFDDLLSAIDAVHEGELHLPAGVWWSVVLELLSERSTRSTQQAFVAGLTERQGQILRCLLVGMTRVEIAKSLHVSPHTVRTHIRDMFRIVGVHSTPHLVARARAAGGTGPLEPRSRGPLPTQARGR